MGPPTYKAGSTTTTAATNSGIPAHKSWNSCGSSTFLSISGTSSEKDSGTSSTPKTRSRQSDTANGSVSGGRSGDEGNGYTGRGGVTTRHPTNRYGGYTSR